MQTSTQVIWRQKKHIICVTLARQDCGFLELAYPTLLDIRGFQHRSWIFLWHRKLNCCSRAALNYCPLEKALGQRGHNQIANTPTPGRLTENCHRFWVSTERSDVFVNPLQGHHLVSEPIVPRYVWVCSGHKSYWTQPGLFFEENIQTL